MRTKILFDPDHVRSVLERLPSLAALIPDPADEGEPSEAFPGVLRKTEREVYRWIANSHYERLAKVIPTLETVHAAGGSFGHLLRTRDREQFVAHTGEVFVAEDLLRRGFTVTTVQRSNTVTPDLHVTGNGIDLAVEVYSPREFAAVDAWLRETSDLMNYVDVRADFESRVSTREDVTIPPGPAPVDPWTLAAAFARTRERVLAEITRDVEAALRDLRPFEKEYAHDGTQLRTTIELEQVQEASPRGPVRSGSISSPGFSGYSPAGIFRKTARKALSKASERQAEGIPARARALVVYLMGTQIAEDLLVPAHFREAEEVANEIEPRDHGLDLITFIVRALPQGLAAIFTVVDSDVLTTDQAHALFSETGGAPPP